MPAPVVPAAPPATPPTPPATPVAAPAKTARESMLEQLKALPETPAPTEPVAPLESHAGATVPPAPGETPPPSPAPSTSPWIEEAQALGFEDIADEDDARTRLREYLQQTTASLRQREAEYQAVLALANKGTEQPKPDQPTPSTNVPKLYDRPAAPEPKLLKLYRTVDATTGKEGWKDNTPADVRVAVDSYEAATQKWADDLIHRPEEVFLPKLQAMAEQIAEKIVEQKLNQVSEQNAAQEFTRSLDAEAWLWQRDPVSGKPAVQNGQKVLSADGLLMSQFCQEAAQLGITNYQAQWKYAQAMRKAAQVDAAASGTTAAEAAKKVNEAKKLEVLQRGVNTLPSRAGSLSPKENPSPRSQNPTQTFKDKLRQELGREGVVLT